MITPIENRLHRLAGFRFQVSGFKIFCLLSIVYCLLIPSCQKEITVDLPETEKKICVEGKIEPGIPPYVILTYNIPYFGPTDINALQNMFIHNAVVKVFNGTSTDTLKEYCSQSLTPSQLLLFAAITGVDTVSLKNFNYCLYTTFSMLGDTNVTYNLTIDVDGKSLTSTTTILNPIPLDSVWYKYLKANKDGDSLGFVYAHLTDPPAPGNCYRWLTMRKGKDQSFMPPPGSAFDDKFINAQSFDLAYNRGYSQNSQNPNDNNEEHGYFKIGDTVIVKFCTIDRAAFDFFRQMDVVLSSEGNPFAAPSSVPSNVYPREDALGIWCGYGVYMDTVIFK